MVPKFIVDANAGKLAKWLRMMGFDTLFFDEPDDGMMVKIALTQDRTIITRDTEFMKRHAVTTHRVRAILVSGDNPGLQMQTVLDVLDLTDKTKRFTRCLECNTELQQLDKKEAEGLVPERVFQIHNQYMICKSCGRIYWRGTHWKAMSDKLLEFESTRPSGDKGGLP
ncbi:MAG: Mut7-C RNAse domain-containing protein [Dehalococcoidia bacterium]|nr:Mut7-C RNAse domain-containing protein [Dehalococcoidia bacterium]